MMSPVNTAARRRVEDYLTRLRSSVPGRTDRPAAVLEWVTQLDNYEPPRDTAHGFMVQTDNAQGDTVVYVLWREDIGASRSRGIERDVFLIDTGRAITPCYVAGWSPTADPGVLVLNPFPLNVNPDGTPRVTGDGVRDGMGRPSRPVDMSGWMLGPRRAWHLKVRPAAA